MLAVLLAWSKPINWSLFYCAILFLAIASVIYYYWYFINTCTFLHSFRTVSLLCRVISFLFYFMLVFFRSSLQCRRRKTNNSALRKWKRNRARRIIVKVHCEKLWIKEPSPALFSFLWVCFWLSSERCRQNDERKVTLNIRTSFKRVIFSHREPWCKIHEHGLLSIPVTFNTSGFSLFLAVLAGVWNIYTEGQSRNVTSLMLCSGRTVSLQPAQQQQPG